MSNYEVVFEDDDYTDSDLSFRDAFNGVSNYINIIGYPPKLTVWHDRRNNVCFGSEQNFYRSPNDFSFFSNKEDFLDLERNPYWGVKHVEEKFGGVFDKEVITTSEMIIQDNGVFDKYKDSKILIVGAGPSAVDNEWKPTDYDYVWTCNKFYENLDLFKGAVIDLALLGPNTDLNDEALTKMGKYTTFLFEAGVSPFRTEEELCKFKERFDDNQVGYFHLRYFSKLGTAARLIVLATLIGAKEVAFIGVDGHPGKQKHAFEGVNKTHEGAPTQTGSEQLFHRQVIMLWEYLLKTLNKGTEYTNLGDGHRANLHSKYMKVVQNTAGEK